MTAQIALENVSLTFAAKPQPFTVLEDISLALAPGNLLCCLAPPAVVNPPFSTWLPGLPGPIADRFWRPEKR